MGRKRKPRLAPSGDLAELLESTETFSQGDESIVGALEVASRDTDYDSAATFEWDKPELSVFENNALPKNRVTIVCFSKADLEEAFVIKQAGRKTGVRCSIFYNGNIPEPGTIALTEDNLAEAFKHSAMIVVLSPDNFKHVCMRAWTSGRPVATMFQTAGEETDKFLNSKYVYKLSRVHQVVLTAKKLKVDCRNKMADTIRAYAFSLLEY
jgi:hypothetical protein